jgi:hypothetical protein
MARPEFMWEVMNVIHASKAETKIPTQEELKAARLDGIYQLTHLRSISPKARKTYALRY